MRELKVCYFYFLINFISLFSRIFHFNGKFLIQYCVSYKDIKINCGKVIRNSPFCLPNLQGDKWKHRKQFQL